jgi:hypothetical protein
MKEEGSDGKSPTRRGRRPIAPMNYSQRIKNTAGKYLLIGAPGRTNKRRIDLTYQSGGRSSHLGDTLITPVPRR